MLGRLSCTQKPEEVQEIQFSKVYRVKKKSYTDKKERIKRLEKIDRKEGKAEKAGQIRKFYYAFSLSNTSQRK